MSRYRCGFLSLLLLMLVYIFIFSDYHFTTKSFHSSSIGAQWDLWRSKLFLGYFSAVGEKEAVKFCPWIPANLTSSVKPESVFKAFAQNRSDAHRHLLPGGEYRPPNCTARESVAIVVAYRDRAEHLKKFLQYIHHFLQKQQLHYMLFIVELTEPTTFNRGLLLNAGFVEASKLRNFTCYVFHDVDLLPTDENNFYRCNNTIRHLSTSNSKFNYRLPYGGYMGGVTAIPPGHFQTFNGFSNLYFGWGGEDDDIASRINNVKLSVSRPSLQIGRYEALPHSEDKGNPINPNRFNLVSSWETRWRKDGLNNLKYDVIKAEQQATHTWILVSVNRTELESVIPKP